MAFHWHKILTLIFALTGSFTFNACKSVTPLDGGSRKAEPAETPKEGKDQANEDGQGNSDASDGDTPKETEVAELPVNVLGSYLTLKANELYSKPEEDGRPASVVYGVTVVDKNNKRVLDTYRISYTWAKNVDGAQVTVTDLNGDPSRAYHAVIKVETQSQELAGKARTSLAFTTESKDGKTAQVLAKDADLGLRQTNDSTTDQPKYDEPNFEDPNAFSYPEEGPCIDPGMKPDPANPGNCIRPSAKP